MNYMSYKFWDIEDKKMYESHEIGFIDLFGGRVIINNEWKFFDEERYGDKVNCMPIQSTGLSDKNKTKIYEGDRVEVDMTGINYNTGKTTGVVKSIDGCFTVEFDIPTYDIVLKCKRSRLYVKCFTVNHAIKVIGNIHDNLENGDKIICATE